MGGENHLHAVVDIRPLGVVVELLRRQGDARHPAERGAEVLEVESLGDGVPARDLAPPGQLGEGGGGPDAGGPAHAARAAARGKTSPVSASRSLRACSSVTTLMAFIPN